MYRIELSPGEETAFRSIEELAVAIRRGVVTSKARIWHNATSKWLPIQFHPHYKTAAAMPLTQADLVAGPPVAPLSSLSLPDPTASATRVTPFRPLPNSPQPEPAAEASRVSSFKPVSPYHQPEPQVREAPVTPPPAIEPIGFMSAPVAAKPEPVKPEPVKPQPIKPLPASPPPAMRVVARAEEPFRKKKRSSSRKPSRRGLRVAFIGAFLIGGAHLLVNADTALKTDALRTHRRLIAAPPEAIKGDSPRTVAAVIPVLRNSSVPGGAGKVLAKPQPRPQPLSKAAPAAAAVPVVSPPMPVSDSTEEIEAAPLVEMPAPAAATDTLARSVVDSTGKKVLKGILKAVSGAPGNDKGPTGK